MKKVLSMSLCAIIIFASCTTNAPDYARALDNRFPIIKLTHNLQNQVLVTPIVDSIIWDYSSCVHQLCYGDGLVLCNPNITDSILAAFLQSKFNICGTSPYIILDEEFAIIDWKWSMFHPLSGTNRRTQYISKSLHNSYSINSYYSISNEEYYLLPTNWTELENLTNIWRMEEAQHIDKPQILYINFKDIENYGNIKKSSKIKYDLLYYDMLWVYNLYKEENDNFNNYVEEMNILQDCYVETLKRMIKNGDLDKWKQK